MARKKLITAMLVGLLLLVAGGLSPVYVNLIWSGEGETFKVDLPIFATSSELITFELAGELPELSDTMMVYKAKAPDVTVERVLEIGRRLGFGGGAGFIDRGTKIAMIDENGGESRQLAVWVNSGAVEYHVGEVTRLYPLTPPTLPSDEEVAEIATQFLAQSGLLPADAHISEVLPGGSYSGPEGEYVTHLLVRFAREIGGVPTCGPGAKFAVRVGDQGEVVALLRVLREVEAYKEVSIEGPSEAYQELATGGGSYLVPSECQRVIIEEVSLAYWMEAAPEKQEYVVPVYEFKGKCLDAEGNYLQDFTAWCQATR
jgi:hypothetical protein